MTETVQQDEFQMSRDEMERISHAMKDKKFCEMLTEYAKEISDPKNKKKYEEEIIAMERQRGQDVRFLTPQPGFVIKTVRLSDNRKVFLNVCSSLEVANHTIQKVSGKDQLSLPHTISPLREDVDKAGGPCVVYDVCFNPRSYERSTKDEKFRSAMIESAFDSIESKLSVRLDRKNKKFPKLKYKGIARPLLLRSQNGNNNTVVSEDSETFEYPKAQPTFSTNGVSQGHRETKAGETDVPNGAVVPSYKIVHRGYFEMAEYTNGRQNSASTSPKELVVEIDLPLTKSSQGIDLDIFEKQLVLKSEKPYYYLDISLPQKVNEDNGKAQFDKCTKVLTVILPILKPVKSSSTVQPLEFVDELAQTSSHINEEPTHLTNGHCENPVSLTCIDSEKDPIVPEVNDCEEINETEVQPDHIQREDMEDKFEKLNDLSLNSQLPPYSYKQTDDEVVVIIHVPDVKVQYLSLGFTEHQVYLDISRSGRDNNSTEWNLVVRLDEEYFLEKDQCGFEVFPDRLELYLRKQNKVIWRRFFVGTSEQKLNLESFATNDGTTNMFENCSVDAGQLPTILLNQTEDEKETSVLESRLEQLLICQEKQKTLDLVWQQEELDSCNENDDLNLNDGLHYGDLHYGHSSEGSDIDLKVNLLDLVDDVIDENSPLTSPTSSLSETRRQKLLDRSLSHDPYQNPRLRSILKRSKSDGGASSEVDTDDDFMYQRTRSVTFTKSNIYSESEDEFGRRRHKSVSFLEEPIVFEIQHASKRQWKRAQWERKQRNDGRKKKAKQIEKNSSMSSTDDDKQDNNLEKQGRKSKKAAKKQRNRNNSESRSEEEHDDQQQPKKKGKRKKKNKKVGVNMNFSTTNNSSDGSVKSDTRSKPCLDNPLIYELD